MLFFTASILALASSVSAVKTSRTFAVNHFYGKGPLTSGRADPIVNPGTQSSHTHTIQGGSNFALTMSDTTLLESTCTSSRVKNDKSNYWTPSLFFQHSNGSFEAVPMFYMNVYYFFEATDDEIKAFQPGHRMVIGNPSLRSPPSTAANVLDLAQGTPQPIQWTCPRSDYNTPAWPAGSDGLHGAGIQDPNNKGAGVGFPDVDCNGFASPLRADIHFPSCYNPAAGLTDYKNNMQFPSSKIGTSGRANCPAGWIHTPHLFYEVYWNTPLFKDLWTQGQGKQPFVLANGDPTGYSLHGDFISGWDVATLQDIIDNCNAGDAGMEECPSVIGGLNDPATTCNIPIPEPAGIKAQAVSGVMNALPGNNPIVGFGGIVGSIPAVAAPVASAVSSKSSSSVPSVAAPAAVASSVKSQSVVVPTKIANVDPTSAVSSAPETTAAPVSPPESSSNDTTVTSTGIIDDVVVTITRTITALGEPTATSTPSTLNGFKSIGCYSDKRYERVLSGKTFVSIGNHQVTSSACIAYCDSKGFSMAGTEFGGECFCGNSLVGSGQIDDAQCNMPCEGDEKEICGGGLALSVFEKPAASRRKARHLHKHAFQHRS